MGNAGSWSWWLSCPSRTLKRTEHCINSWEVPALHPHPAQFSSFLPQSLETPVLHQPSQATILNWSQRGTACRSRKDCKPLRSETLQRAGLEMKTCPPTQRANIPSPSSLEMKPDNTVWRKRERCCPGCLSRQSPNPAHHSAASHKARRVG